MLGCKGHTVHKSTLVTTQSSSFVKEQRCWNFEQDSVSLSQGLGEIKVYNTSSSISIYLSYSDSKARERIRLRQFLNLYQNVHNALSTFKVPRQVVLCDILKIKFGIKVKIQRSISNALILLNRFFLGLSLESKSAGYFPLLEITYSDSLLDSFKQLVNILWRKSFLQPLFFKHQYGYSKEVGHNSLFIKLQSVDVRIISSFRIIF